MLGDLLKDFEAVRGLKAGTKFYKADLHFHTPASEDARGANRYNFNPYKISYPKRINNPNYQKEVMAIQNDILAQARSMASKIVQRFLEVGLSVVAVTDHNGIGTIWADHESDAGLMDLAAPTWYEIIDDEAQNVNDALGYTELLILPGVEISTTGVHILAIFPPQSPRRKIHFMICDLLNETGFGVDDFGKNPRVGNASVYDAIELVTKKGGLPIPAHIDGSDQAMLSLYELTSGAMRNVLQNGNLRAVEIVDPDKFSRPDKKTKESLKVWLDNVRRTDGLPSLAYFQGSDAHDLPTISKRFTYLKMTEPSFSGLQTAVKMPSSRVRIPESFKKLNGLYIQGVVFDHPFLGQRSLSFNRNLNCISGKRGAGKTSMFDLMQGVVNPQCQMDGTATLFVEQVREDASEYYAYQRDAGQTAVKVFSIDGQMNTFKELTLEEAKARDLQPGFYNAERMEQIILDPAQLQEFLCRTFGEATDLNVKKFNEFFSTPPFLDQKSDPLLAVTSKNKKDYQLALNMQWRVDKPVMKDFFRLSLSQRRIAMMCMIILSGRFGPVIIDAPEDEFDNEDMTRYLVPVIQEQKDARQMLLFTNHPILAVNTDPDNYLLMQLEDGKLKSIVSGFAIDARAQRPLLLGILEGSMDAFRKRASRYE